MKEKVRELRLLGKGYKTISKELGISKDMARYYSKKSGLAGFKGDFININQYGNLNNREKRFKKSFEKRFPEFSYHSGYTGSDEDFNMECKICGHIQTRNAQKMRPSRDKGLVCDNCSELLQKRRCLINVLSKRINKIIREIEKDKRSREKEESRKIIKKCVECGKEFVTTKKKVVCCSKECAKKRANNHKDRRLRKCNNIDWGITLSKLIKRDKNVCHICGGKCDKKDYTINKDGHFIVGSEYPSIDHLVPISKGGQHTWENVKLAHFYCNTIKRDSEVYEGLNNQLVLTM